MERICFLSAAEAAEYGLADQVPRPGEEAEHVS